jgi:hypothetical protein
MSKNGLLKLFDRVCDFITTLLVFVGLYGVLILFAISILANLF